MKVYFEEYIGFCEGDNGDVTGKKVMSYLSYDVADTQYSRIIGSLLSLLCSQSILSL